MYVCMYLFICLRRLLCIWQHEADVDLLAVNTHNEQRPDHNTGTPRPTLFDKCVGPLLAYYNEDAGDGAYGLSSLSEKT